MKPPENCPHCANSDDQVLWRDAVREISTLRSTLRDCLPYLSTRRSVGEIEARERALAVLGEVEPTEPK